MLLLPLTHLALALFRFRRVRGWLERSSAIRTQSPCTADAIADGVRLAELAEIAGRRGAVEASCLRQALIVWWWLRRRGLPAQLCVGANGSGESFAAHAWIELQGVALTQNKLPYRTFDGL